MNALQKKLSTLTTEMLKNVCKTLEHNHGDAETKVFQNALDELERRLPEADFADFVNSFYSTAL